jgi:hypothetical protein
LGEVTFGYGGSIVIDGGPVLCDSVDDLFDMRVYMVEGEDKVFVRGGVLCHAFVVGVVVGVLVINRDLCVGIVVRVGGIEGVCLSGV